jgi:hypothetical protein
LENKAKYQNVVVYIRERGVNDDSPYAAKFASFIQAVAEAKSNGCGVIRIAAPWVIGDTYDELTKSLSHLAGTGVSLLVVPVR